MARVTKATAEQARRYEDQHIADFGTRPVYPLYGYVNVGGKQCAVEFPNEGHHNPKYEVMAPKGFHFSEGLHSLLCVNMEDLQTRIAQSLEPCGESCKEAA